ncbi:Coiled-coil and C2 domain-containing protein 2A [Toxocara canis]|uniref:Coiled-coil and C2 domain-containing protein 2A n=1 Tax=Toxocara canis TaxID=6265 RepID=A0A0B2VI14_TOXCA|nr:Coiled-coil and C2 domain-containing protein 2A [Toxocara canis]
MEKEIEEIGSVYQDTPPSTSSTKVAPEIDGARKKRTMSWMEDVDEKDESFDGKQKELIDKSTPPPLREKSEGDLASDRRSQDERVKSPTSSISSKRTSTSSSDLLSATLRTKIRQQAKSKLEHKRGNIQLTKRLQRNQTQTIEEEPSSTIDEDLLDAQIEYSLKLGSKFVSHTDDSRLPPESVQFDFVTATYDENVTEDHSSTTKRKTFLFFAKPKPQPRSDEEEFQRLCITYEKKRSPHVDAETGMQRTGINFFFPESKYDYSILKQRLGSDFIDSSGNVLGSEPFLTDKPLKPDRDDDERPLCTYMKAEDWKTASKHFEQKQFAELDIDINRVVFDHHWLFSKEDMICSVIRNLHTTQTIRANEALLILRELISEKRRAETSDPADINLQSSIETKIAELISDLEEKQNNYIRLGQLIEENWHRLRLTRLEQGFSSTTLTVQKSISTAEEIADSNLSNLSEHLQGFTRIPVYTLTDTNTISEEKPKEEIERLTFIPKCHIQMLIHFNDILVCKTKFRPLNSNFAAVFGQIYNLQIHEIPQSITITVIEKAPKVDARVLAKIGLPLPDGDKVTSTDTPLDIVEFGSDLIIDRMFTAVGCGGESPCISAKLFCNAYWSERGVRTNRDGNICAPFNQRHEKYQQKGVDRFELIPKVVRLCSDEEFDSDLRFEALRQRSERKLTKSKAMHRIGLISADIDPQILASDEQKINDQLRISTGIDAHRIAGNQYAAMIRLLFFLIPEISKLLLFQPSNS